MKKFFKFGCLGIIGIVVLIIVIALFAGGEEEKISTGGTATETDKVVETEPVAEEGVKTIDATAQSTEALGLKIGLGEIKIENDRIKVGMNVENTSDKTITFYPDQGSAVVGNIQLDANLFMTDGDVSGEIQSGVQKEGVIEFLVPEGKTLDVATVKEIKLALGDVVDDSYLNSKTINIVIPVK